MWYNCILINTEANIIVLGFFSSRFPNNVLFTSASGELWKMVRIGGQPLGFGEYFVAVVMDRSRPHATTD